MTSSPPPAQLGGAALCLISGAGFATLSVLAKFAFATGLSLPVMLGFRFAGAAVILGTLLVLRRRPAWLGARRTGMLLALGGIGYAGQSTLYFHGLQRSPASLSSVLLYVYPVFVALLSWAVTGRRPSSATALALGLALAGVVLTAGRAAGGIGQLAGGIGQVAVGSTRMDTVGALFVLASAAAYSIYIVVSHRVVPQGEALVSTFWIAAGAAISFLSAAAIGPGLALPAQGNGVAIIAAMAVISTALPLTTFLAGMARVGPTAAALLSTFEPVFTVGLAAAFLGESLSAQQGLGAALVLGAVVLLQASGIRASSNRDIFHN